MEKFEIRNFTLRTLRSFAFTKDMSLRLNGSLGCGFAALDTLWLNSFLRLERFERLELLERGKAKCLINF